MKKSIALLCGLVLLCGAVSGCQKEPTPPVSSIPDQSRPTDTAPVFQPGTWMASGQYYFFDADKIGGRTANYENGMGLGFTYRQQGDQTVFCMGAHDNPLPCTVIVTDDTHLTLEWEAQQAEELTFLSPLDSEHFHFYTDEELCALALEDYQAKYEPADGLTAAAMDNGDGTVTIQLYQNLGDHNSTAAWYQIDRITGEGLDVSSGDPIDLTNGAPDMEILRLDSEAAALPESYYECTVDTTQYSSRLLLSPEVPVKEFRVVLLEYAEAENDRYGFRITQALFAADSLTPEQPLVLHTELPEIIPRVGITYLDRNGTPRLYAVCESGLDGAVLLVEEPLL